MGLFSSSYKYYAYAGSDSLFDEDNRPNTVLSLMLNGILGNSASPPEAIITGLNTNLYARARSMVRYAAKEGGYIFGFPETNQVLYGITNAMLRPYVEAEAGGPIVFNSTNWGDPLPHEAFWIERGIQENYASWFTGDPPADPVWTVTAATVEIPVVNPDTSTYYQADNNFDAVVTAGSVVVTFSYTDNLSNPQTWSAPAFSISTYQTGQWIMVRYRPEPADGHFYYWIYEIGSNAIPDLEEDLGTASLNMGYLPIAVLMHDTVWFDESGNQEWEDTLDRLLKDLALDPYDIKEQYLEQQAEDDASGDSNRGNAEDWDFFIHFAVPLKTTFRGGREYLFKFYDFLRQNASWTTFADYEAFVSGGGVGEQPYSELVVQEGVEYTGYIARFAWSYIHRTDVNGEFTPPGWTDPLLPRRLWSETYKWGDSNYSEGLDLMFGAGNYTVAPSQPDGQEHAYTIVTRMNEDDTHSHIIMMGPSMEYQINTSEDPVGVGAGGYVDYRYRFVDVELFPDDPEQDSEFRWPVHIASLKEVSAMQREAALADGLCATVFLVEQQKVKWYQTGFFKWLIIVIAVIVIILAWQYELLPTIAAAAGAATGATALGLWALYVVLTFAIGFLVSFAGSLIGGNLGQLFVIVGMYMAMGGSFNNVNPFSNINNAWTNVTTQPSWGSAIQFIKAVYPALSTGQKIYANYQLHKLESEMRDFTKTAKEKYEQLQDAWDSLQETPNWIDPLDLARTFATNGLYEDPASFYYRTLHANPGSLGYDLIQNFTDMALTLPDNPLSPGVVDSMLEQFAEQRGQV